MENQYGPLYLFAGETYFLGKYISR